MVVMAEAFLQVLEARAMEDALFLQPPVQPISYMRFVDDSHSRFESIELSENFLVVLNTQHPNIKYTMEKENNNKELEFLDIKIINNGTGKYEYDIFRKKAITNVQVKPESSHDPSTLRGIFKGFIYRAIAICSEKYVNQEIDFLIKVFVENGYDKKDLIRMVDQVKATQTQEQIISNDTNPSQTISLPWIPGVSPKLKKVYRKAGYKVAFKSNQNLKGILTSKNKTKLPKNSFPGVYKIPCSCDKTPYRGETKKKISTRAAEHGKYIENGEWEKSGVAAHSSQCEGTIDFENTETVKVIHNRFDRKIRETL